MIAEITCGKNDEENSYLASARITRGRVLAAGVFFSHVPLIKLCPMYKARLYDDSCGPRKTPASRQDRMCRKSALFTHSHVANRVCACCWTIAVLASNVCTIRDIPSGHQCLADNNSKPLTLGSSAWTEQCLALLQRGYKRDSNSLICLIDDNCLRIVARNIAIFSMQDVNLSICFLLLFFDLLRDHVDCSNRFMTTF